MTHATQQKIKQVERALLQNQLDDARGLLLEDSHARRLSVGQLLSNQIVERIAQRAESHYRRGDTSAAWRDLNGARELSPEAVALKQSRDKVIAAALDEVEQALKNNDPDAALLKLDKLHQRNVAGGRAAILRQVALKARRAERLRKVGKFDEAASNWKAAQKLRDDMNIFEQFATLCRAQAVEGKGLIDQLQQAMRSHEWDVALDAADRLLEMAPQHPAAREARDEAWEKVSADLSDSQRKRRTASWRKAKPDANAPQEPSSLARRRLTAMLAVTGVGKCENRRLQLWVDAVGGYLVCLGREVVLGQAVPGADVDIPIFGNLARRHGIVRRDEEGYMLVPEAEIHVEGRTLDGPRFLCDGDEIQLGDGVRMRFRRPHPLSASASLEPLSGHRTQPASDVVLLMADSLVLGRKMDSHIVCRDWNENVMLFRQGDDLFCQGGEEFEIDGRLLAGQGRLSASSHVRGRDFSLSVEEI